MMYDEYKKAFYAAAQAAGIGPSPINRALSNRIIVEYLPLDVLHAVAKGEIVEDASVILNNPDIGKPTTFFSSWVTMCEEEIIERLLTDKS